MALADARTTGQPQADKTGVLRCGLHRSLQTRDDLSVVANNEVIQGLLQRGFNQQGGLCGRAHP